MSVPQTVKVLWCKWPRRTSMPWQDFLSSTSGTFLSHCLQMTFIPSSSRQMVGQYFLVLSFLLWLFQQKTASAGSVGQLEKGCSVHESWNYDGSYRHAWMFFIRVFYMVYTRTNELLPVATRLLCKRVVDVIFVIVQLVNVAAALLAVFCFCSSSMVSDLNCKLLALYFRN